jgi:hypothetical protein
MLEPGDFVVRRRDKRGGAIQRGGRQRIQRAVDQRGLAGAGHAGDAGQQAQGDLEIDALQVVAGGAASRSWRFGSGAWRFFGSSMRASAGKVGAGQGRLFGHDGVGVALGHDRAAVHAGAGTDVDDVVGGADGVLVVLHHQHRVAQIAQVREGAQQALVVALVQADGRLVEDVHHAHQPGADL